MWPQWLLWNPTENALVRFGAIEVHGLGAISSALALNFQPAFEISVSSPTTLTKSITYWRRIKSYN